ncbi:hypothetical protein D3C87_1988830 [compost metagenome]
MVTEANWREELDKEVSDPQLNIWIGHLLRYHKFKYPIHWYTNQSESKVRGMYKQMLRKH